jgi:PAS domain S-box-containing protein
VEAPDNALTHGRTEEQLLADFFENAAVGLHWVGPDGTILRANRAELEMLGYSKEEYIGHHIAEFHVDRPIIEDILTKLSCGETLHNHEARLRCKDGSIRHVLISSNVLWEDGKFIHTRCFTRDITEQEHARQELRQSENLKSAILDAALDAIITMNHEGIVTDFNPAAERIFGYPASSAIGRTVAELIIPPRLREAHRSGISRYLATGHGPVLDQRIEQSALHAKGHEFPVELSISRIAGTEPPAFTATLRDITETRRLLSNERAARAEAERMSAIKDEFLATLSHELRTPLSAILGWTQVLRRGTRDDADFHKGLETIERNARMQTQLIEDLLDMSRIASGQVRLDTQTVQPVSFIEAAIETVRPSAEAKGIRIEKVLDPVAGPIAGDPGRLQQVMWNLLSNAVKFTPKNGKVQVLLARVSSHIEISVADTGVGIRPEFLAHVFERFRQADASTTREYGGLGLGLSIVKHLIELHGGTVRADSAGEGQGAVFRVELPLTVLRSGVHDQARLHPAAPTPGPSDVTFANLSGIKVLVVDDEADARDLISRLLVDCGADVLTARSAIEGLEIIKREKPLVLVSDIGMPSVDGYEFLKQVRALGKANGGAVHAIALTAFARSEDRTRALRAGFLNHVVKPVEASELIASVASAAGRSSD